MLYEIIKTIGEYLLIGTIGLVVGVVAVFILYGIPIMLINYFWNNNKIPKFIKYVSITILSSILLMVVLVLW